MEIHACHAWSAPYQRYEKKMHQTKTQMVKLGQKGGGDGEVQIMGQLEGYEMLFNRVLLELVMKFLREWFQGLYSSKMAFEKKVKLRS